MVFNSRFVSGEVEDGPKLLVDGIFQLSVGCCVVKEHGLLAVC